VCNLVYVHLLSARYHVEGCNADGCADGCGIRALHDTLAAPLLPQDFRMHRRFEDRLKRLTAGEIPA
jgi:hypothetical protein